MKSACALVSAFVVLLGAVGQADAKPVLLPTVIDTTPSWNFGGIGGMGGSGVVATGQTFIAPTSESRLDSITMFLDELNPSDTATDFAVYVMDWSVDRAAGSVLFRSSDLSTNGVYGGPISTSTNVFENFTVNTGGVNLTPGEDYVVFASTAGFSLGIDQNVRTGHSSTDVYPDGEAFFAGGPTSPFSSLTSSSWSQINFPGPGDLAIILGFNTAVNPPVDPSASVLAPEPATVLYWVILALGSLAYAFRRRRKLVAT